MRSLVVAAVMLAGSLGHAADAGTPRFVWEVPEMLESVPVTGPIKALGVPLKLRAVRSRASMETLFRHFLELFEKANLFVPPMEGQFQIPGGLQLTGVDTHSHVSYTVIFQPNPDKTTTVILGEADVFHRDPPQASGLPLFPTAHDVLQSSSEGYLTVTYEAQTSPRELASFYRQVLSRAGYRETDGAFVKDGEEMRVTAQGATDGGTVFVTLVDRKAAPPPEPDGPSDAGR